MHARRGRVLDRVRDLVVAHRQRGLALLRLRALRGGADGVRLLRERRHAVPADEVTVWVLLQVFLGRRSLGPMVFQGVCGLFLGVPQAVSSGSGYFTCFQGVVV